MTIPEILLIMVIHWLADFCLQSDWQAKNKWKDFDALFYHVSTYTLTWFLASYCIFDSWDKAGMFAIITFVCHFLTDLCTSKMSHHHFDKGDTHNAFVIIGFDQILHYIQLFTTFVWLKSLV